MKHGLRRALLLTFVLGATAAPSLGAAEKPPAFGAAAATVMPSAAPAPAQSRRGYRRRRRRGRVRRALKAPYKAVKVSGKATGRAVKVSGEAVGRTLRRAFGTRRRTRY